MIFLRNSWIFLRNSWIFLRNSLIFLRDSLIFLRESWGGPQASHPEVPNGSQMELQGDPPCDSSETLTFAIRSRLCMFFAMSEKQVQQEGGRGEGKPSPLLLEGSKHTTKGRRILGSM